MGVLERQIREETILNAAAKVFFACGYGNAKMSDVAKEAGLSKGLVYFYYNSKEDLYLSVILHATKMNIQFLEEAVAQVEEINAFDKLIHLLKSYFSFSKNYPFYQEAISNFISMVNPIKQVPGNSFLESVKNNPIYKDILQMQYQPMKLLSGIMIDGIRDGSIKTTLNPIYLYMTVWSMMIGYEKLNISEEEGNKIASSYTLDNKEWQETIIKIISKILKST